MKSYKIIAGLLISLLVFGTTFADDLTDKEKAKGDKIVQKVEKLINSKNNKFETKENYVLLLSKMKGKTTNSNIINLIQYVIDGINNKYQSYEINNKNFINKIDSSINEYSFKKEVVKKIKYDVNNLKNGDLNNYFDGIFNKTDLSKYGINNSNDLEKIIGIKGINYIYDYDISEDFVNIEKPLNDYYLKNEKGEIIGVLLKITGIKSKTINDNFRGELINESIKNEINLVYGIDNKLYTYYEYPVKFIKDIKGENYNLNLIEFLSNNTGSSVAIGLNGGGLFDGSKPLISPEDIPYIVQVINYETGEKLFDNEIYQTQKLRRGYININLNKKLELGKEYKIKIFDSIFNYGNTYIGDLYFEGIFKY